MEELTAPLTTEVESFTIDTVDRSVRSSQGHREVGLKGRFARETITFPTGSVIVRTAQPLGTLAAYLLEPESEDGLVTWNFLDAYLGVGRVFPVRKLMHEVNVRVRPVLRQEPVPGSPLPAGANDRSPRAISDHEE